ncbi:MAG: hypothetical protein HOJ35_01760 [Bdellovibrionales bacterium]|nr:hypothetical protein [Bdellovibrionales bacterium]
MSEGYIIYIEKEAALRKALEIAFRDSEFKLYTMDSPENLSLLIEDLSPKLIIVDQDTVGDLLLSNFFKSDLTFITTSRETVNYDLNDSIYIKKPFSPIELLEIIESKLNL